MMCFVEKAESGDLASVLYESTVYRPVYIESRVCVVKEVVMCSFEY